MQPVYSVDEIFSQLSPDDEKALVSLPYRVGLYISYADVTGGWDAQEKELQSLTGILREFSEDFYKTEFSQKVLMECLKHRSAWPSLSHNINGVPDQLSEMLKTLSAFLDESERGLFLDVLMDIGIAVAMAFRESGEGAEPHRPLVRELLGRLSGALIHKNPLDHINISDTERAALLRLADATGYSKF